MGRSTKTAKTKNTTDVIKNLEQELDRGNRLITVRTSCPEDCDAVREYVRNISKPREHKFISLSESFNYGDFMDRPVASGTMDDPNPVYVNAKIDGSFKGFCRHVIEDNLSLAFSEANKILVEMDLLEISENIEKTDRMILDSRPAYFQELFSLIYDGLVYYTDETLRFSKDFNIFDVIIKGYQLSKKKQKRHYVVLENTAHIDISAVMDNPPRFLPPEHRGFDNRADIRYMNLKSFRIHKNGAIVPVGFDCFKDGFYVPENLYGIMIV